MMEIGGQPGSHHNHRQALKEWRQQKFLSPNHPNEAILTPLDNIPAVGDRQEQASAKLLAAHRSRLSVAIEGLSPAIARYIP